MSISNNIDGSVGGANQLLDLLALVSNPAVYEAKVQSLQAAIAENKKYVEAVAPVSEILDLRDKVTADKAASAAALAEAKSTAKDLVSKAQAQAADIISSATTQATQLTMDAQAAKDAALLAQNDAVKATAEVRKAKVNYDKLSGTLQAQLDSVAKAQADADATRQSYEDLKADLVAKHTAFIQGL
jgi:cell division septum initiation protein DivIVA